MTAPEGSNARFALDPLRQAGQAAAALIALTYLVLGVIAFALAIAKYGDYYDSWSPLLGVAAGLGLSLAGATLAWGLHMVRDGRPWGWLIVAALAVPALAAIVWSLIGPLVQ